MCTKLCYLPSLISSHFPCPFSTPFFKKNFFIHLFIGCTKQDVDLSSLTRDQTRAHCSGRWSLNHRTTREIPILCYSNFLSLLFKNVFMCLWLCWVFVAQGPSPFVVNRGKVKGGLLSSSEWEPLLLVASLVSERRLQSPGLEAAPAGGPPTTGPSGTSQTLFLIWYVSPADWLNFWLLFFF